MLLSFFNQENRADCSNKTSYMNFFNSNMILDLFN